MDELESILKSDASLVRAKLQHMIEKVPLNECIHSEWDLREDEGVEICKECGLQRSIVDFQKEWRYFGSSDNRHSKDPARCHKTRHANRLDDILNGLPLGIDLKRRVEQAYVKIVGDVTYRGKTRAGIVGACIFYISYTHGIPLPSSEIHSMLKIDPRNLAFGKKLYLQKFSEDKYIHIQPKDLVEFITRRVGINSAHVPRLKRMCEYFDDTSQVLKRSRPDSVAAAIIALYLMMHPQASTKKFQLSDFAKDANLSEVTITRLLNAARDVIKQNEN